ncbi:MAG TPA: cupin domain-containing protein [Casimicrobiaceae bacterium]|nr:cupin domain-containing protein [Casimicrobiaceae bacterium]
MTDGAINELLGGLGAAAFLRKYWQKRPLLVRQAVAGFRGFLSRSELFALAGRDDVESRLVRHARGQRTLTQGPFRATDLTRLPARDWTLLVQGVNLRVAAADALLRRFAFIPYARLDDVMVSYAAPGGGVGPHVDSYDVFLLQGEGRRRWRLGGQTRQMNRQRDLTLGPSLPVKILTRLRPDAEYMLDAGDMLYLPPSYAHDGVAVDACTTYSIGFRAPSAQELGTAFLDWMRDSIVLDGRYADPLLAPAAEPARIGLSMQKRCSAMLAGVRWSDALVSRFIGCYLSEPKPSVFFEPPSRPLGLTAFRSAAARRGVSLDRRTQLLYDSRNVFLNGSTLDSAGCDSAVIKRLANARHLSGVKLAGSNSTRAAAVALLHRWYRDGFLHLG